MRNSFTKPGNYKSLFSPHYHHHHNVILITGERKKSKQPEHMAYDLSFLYIFVNWDHHQCYATIFPLMLNCCCFSVKKSAEWKNIRSVLVWSIITGREDLFTQPNYSAKFSNQLNWKFPRVFFFDQTQSPSTNYNVFLFCLISLFDLFWPLFL